MAKKEAKKHPKGSVAEAEEKAAALKSKKECEEGILEEAQALESGEQHSIQQMLAYVRLMKKLDR